MTREAEEDLKADGQMTWESGEMMLWIDASGVK